MIDNDKLNRKIKSLSKDFINSGLAICRKNERQLTKNDELYPEQNAGKYLKSISKNITIYDYFVEKSIFKELEELNDFNSLNLVLSEQPIKKYYQNFYHQKGEKIPSNVENLTKNLPKKLLTHYLSLTNNFNFDNMVFEKCFKEFMWFLDNYLMDEYIVPLYNFKTDLKNGSLKFGDIVLRPITEYEFKIISKLGKFAKILPIDTELTHVLSLMATSESIDSGFNTACIEFRLFLDSITLNFIGDLQLATIYQNINYSWKPFEIGDIIKNIHPRSPLEFPKNNHSQLNSFYHTLKKSEIGDKENLFVKMAIRRFQIGINRISTSDRIIDFVTSLESLYASGPGDVTRKLSQRCCMVVGTNDEQHEFYHDFLKKAYNFRSGLVHGEYDREITINGKILKSDEVCKLLEKITRDSIKKYLKLINHYSGNGKNKKIIKDIDNSIINRKNYTIFKKKF